MEAVLAMLALIAGINFLDKNSTQIVLLDSNKTSSITLKTAYKSELLSTPNEYLSINNINQNEKRVLNNSEVEDKFGSIIKVSVDKPISYKLYFTNSDSLDEKSLKIIPKIKQTIKDRYPCEVSIIGHTDTIGSNDINKKVSLKRAKKVAGIFKDENISRVDIYSFGESNLLVKTADNVFEPKNRRVEIQIR
ncbi:OmpA family protein [Campylobacter corcagiensis]|uniref:OmpA family protein n=1 Tax=Campylobacter corcagiensis TaxID=1448857 RepID=A0A7M1LHE4_9BACT|nr:OmpA family protein [Campylobacter corcagiensis]QKF65412.1 OmpA domain-containing protein [Campylobacter corcagiensis]QOQ88012.1 OmpA family protein [Campylobacter corcagiensis]